MKTFVRGSLIDFYQRRKNYIRLLEISVEMTTSLATALERLAAYRTNNTRASQETFEHGCLILKSGSKTEFGDDGMYISWASLNHKL